jgi:hypothetical protein
MRAMRAESFTGYGGLKRVDLPKLSTAAQAEPPRVAHREPVR